MVCRHILDGGVSLEIHNAIFYNPRNIARHTRTNNTLKYGLVFEGIFLQLATTYALTPNHVPNQHT